MTIKRVIIKCENLSNHQAFEDTLRLSLGAEYDIKYIDNLIYLEIFDFEDTSMKMNIIFEILSTDFNAKFIMLLVPIFDNLMIKLINSINTNGIYNAYQILNKLLIENKITKKDIPNYLENIDKDLLKIFTIYYESNLNICLTSRLLYLHRNTLNYKLNKLCDDLNMDIRNLLVANFIYLLIKII